MAKAAFWTETDTEAVSYTHLDVYKRQAREGLPVSCRAEAAKVVEAAMHDKKARQESIFTVQVKKAGEYEFVPLDREGLLRAYSEVFA